MKYLSIKSKVAILAAISVIGFIIIAIVFFSSGAKRQGLMEQRETAREAYELINDIKYNLLNARRREKDFLIRKDEKYIICEDIITTGGSALEAASQIEADGGEIVAYASLANRGFCSRVGSDLETKDNCKLPLDKPLFALEDFTFEMYSPEDCPMCKDGSIAYKPGSRGN